MTDLETRRRRAVERLLEDESLTAELTDDAAKILLDWGVAQAEAVAQKTQELPREELDAYLTALRCAMSRISELAGEYAPEAQEEQLQVLLAGIETEPDTENKSAQDSSANFDTR